MTDKIINGDYKNIGYKARIIAVSELERNRKLFMISPKKVYVDLKNTKIFFFNLINF